MTDIIRNMLDMTDDMNFFLETLKDDDSLNIGNILNASHYLRQFRAQMEKLFAQSMRKR